MSKDKIAFFSRNSAESRNKGYCTAVRDFFKRCVSHFLFSRRVTEGLEESGRQRNKEKTESFSKIFPEKRGRGFDKLRNNAILNLMRRKKRR